MGARRRLRNYCWAGDDLALKSPCCSVMKTGVRIPAPTSSCIGSEAHSWLPQLSTHTQSTHFFFKGAGLPANSLKCVGERGKEESVSSQQPRHLVEERIGIK